MSSDLDSEDKALSLGYFKCVVPWGPGKERKLCARDKHFSVRILCWKLCSVRVSPRPGQSAETDLLVEWLKHN